MISDACNSWTDDVSRHTAPPSPHQRIKDEAWAKYTADLSNSWSNIGVTAADAAAGEKARAERMLEDA
jgi:hypothetical protein